MKNYVLGLICNHTKTRILLIEKQKPDWMRGRWNGIGGKIEENETPEQAMSRECEEETGFSRMFYIACIFICPGGTVYVMVNIGRLGGDDQEGIYFEQREQEKLQVWSLDNLPSIMMENLKWLIPVCLYGNFKQPPIFYCSTLGVGN